MDEHELEGNLADNIRFTQEVQDDNAERDADYDPDVEEFANLNIDPETVQTFHEAGIMTQDFGLVFKDRDGKRFALTIKEF